MSEDQFRDMPFKDALELAARENRVVIADFYTTWCESCKKLDKITWRNGKVKAWLKTNAVAVKIDAERNEDAARRYSVRLYPTILILRRDGKELDRLVGCRDADTFLSEVKDALAGRDELTRLRDKIKNSGEEEPDLRMELGNALAARGRNPEALKEYLWAFDKGRANPAFKGVRVSFLLDYIVGLGNVYPSAIGALKTRRALLKRKLLTGAVDDDSISELGSLNYYLKEPVESLVVYDSLVKSGKLSKQGKQRFGFHVFNPMLGKRRYGDIVSLYPDPLDVISRKKGEYIKQFDADYMKDKSRSERKRLMNNSKHYQIIQMGKYYEAFLGARKKELAEKILEAILAFDSSGFTFNLLIGCANRAGDRKTADALVKRARSQVGWWKWDQRKLISRAESAITR